MPTMKLIGMLDSPFVRRVAISFQCLDLPFEHEPWSVFRQFEAVRSINPLVKVPTLVLDDGQVLLDSNLILDYAEHRVGRSLWPTKLPERITALRLTGLALSCCEKAVQVVYEQRTRPEDKQHGPWMARIQQQLAGGFQALEAELTQRPLPHPTQALGQAGISVAVAWTFVHHMLPQPPAAQEHPALAAYTAQAEQLAPFKAAACGDGRYPVTA
jgi:glutathione S-transferase